MIFVKDQIGRTQQCLYLAEVASVQSATREVFFNIVAVGYDGIRRTVLFSFNTREEQHKKYLELRKEYDLQVDKELERRDIEK